MITNRRNHFLQEGKNAIGSLCFCLCVCTCGSRHVVPSTGHPAAPQASPVERERWLSVICHVLTGDYAKDLRLLKRQCWTPHSQVAKECWKQTYRPQITAHFNNRGTAFLAFEAKVHRDCSLQHQHKQQNDSYFYQHEACIFTYDLTAALLKFLAIVHRAGPRRFHKSAKLRIWN